MQNPRSDSALLSEGCNARSLAKSHSCEGRVSAIFLTGVLQSDAKRARSPVRCDTSHLSVRRVGVRTGPPECVNLRQ